MRSAAYRQDGLLVILGAGDPAGALLVSRQVASGRVVRTRYDSLAVLRTAEDVFALDHLGHAADASTRSFASDLLASGAQASARAAGPRSR